MLIEVDMSVFEQDPTEMTLHRNGGIWPYGFVLGSWYNGTKVEAHAGGKNDQDVGTKKKSIIR